MSTITVTAPAKVNLHLEVLGLRPDGFHELAMVMQSIDLADQLTFQNRADAQVVLSCDDPSLSLGDDNLIVRAARLLRDRSGFSELGATIHLSKRIPIGAGLAGGSSDGAATLVGLNTLWGLGNSRQQLEAAAADLGSDMPFCVSGGRQLCFGRGERLEPCSAAGTSLAVLLVKNPAVSVSTPWAYQRCKELQGATYLSGEEAFELRRQTLRTARWLNQPSASCPPPLRNDLQQVVEPEVEAVQQALALLRTLPDSLAVAMSGSGPSCFALMENMEACHQARDQLAEGFFAAGLQAWCCALQPNGVTVQVE